MQLKNCGQCLAVLWPFFMKIFAVVELRFNRQCVQIFFPLVAHRCHAIGYGAQRTLICAGRKQLVRRIHDGIHSALVSIIDKNQRFSGFRRTFHNRFHDACIGTLGSGNQCHDTARNPGKQAKCNKRGDQCGRSNIPKTFNLRQLRPGVHKDYGAQKHAKLADPIKGPRFNRSQSHGQIDEEKWDRRYQPQRE